MKVSSIKPLSESLDVKYPMSSGLSRELASHYDFPSLPIDRAEAVRQWLALVPITPEMGPMTHLNSSHREMIGHNGEDSRELYRRCSRNMR